MKVNQSPNTQRRHSKHPDAGTNLFRRHLAMCDRHEHEIDPCWRDYDEFKQDVSPAPHSLSLIRKDNNQPWGPNNFHWATTKEKVEQVHGKTITIFGDDYPSWETAAKHFNMPASTLKQRIKEQGMSPEEAVTKPVRGRKND